MNPADETSHPPGAFYDDVWQHYGSLDAVSPAAFHRRRILARLALDAAPKAARLFDAGCGQGELLSVLARSLPGASLAGGDVSEESRRRAKERLPAVEMRPFDLESASFETEQADLRGGCDLVVCSEVLEHLKDDLSAARRLATLLVPGGTLLVSVPGGRPTRFDELIGHQRHYRVKELRSLLERAGFEVERAFSWGFPFHNLYRALVRGAARVMFRQPGKATAPPKEGATSLSSRAYALSGKILQPLYYLNRPYWGEQLFAVARRK